MNKTLRWLQKLPPEERITAIQEAFSTVAATPDGRIVLGVILSELQLFDPIESDDARALHNFGLHVLRYLGLTSSDIESRAITALLSREKE